MSHEHAVSDRVLNSDIGTLSRDDDIGIGPRRHEFATGVSVKLDLANAHMVTRFEDVRGSTYIVLSFHAPVSSEQCIANRLYASSLLKVTLICK